MKLNKECPQCKKGTKRERIMVMTTCAFYPVILDENGNNISPDRNTTVTEFKCLECGTKYSVSTQLGKVISKR